VNEEAWQKLEKGHGSAVSEVKEAVAEAMKRRKK
jgi:hypothetical protein